MKMIIGGAYQGQAEWARKHYKDISWIDGETCGFADIFTCEGILNFHAYIRRLIRAEWERKDRAGSHKDRAAQRDISSRTLAEQLIAENPDLIIVSDEIGYGLVPVDAFDRQYREQTGRICTKLAAHAERVVRVVMGIGSNIK